MESNEYLYKADLRKSLTQLVFEADLAKKQTEELIKNGQAITQPELDETNARISEIIAHNGDGTKDTEVIDARKGQTTLRDKINLIDSDIDQIVKQSESIPSSNLNFMIPIKNLFDKNNTLLNTSIDIRTGETMPYVGEQVSAYIRVEPNTSYVNTIGRPVVFYDIDKNIISVVTGQITYITPSNCSYIRASLIDFQADKLQIEKGVKSTEYEPFFTKAVGVVPDSARIEPKSIASDKLNLCVEVADTDFISSSKNLLNLNTVIMNKRFDFNTGELVDATSHISEFIRVEPNTSYVINRNDTTDIAYYSYDKSYLGYSRINDTTPKTTPINCYYVRLKLFPINLQKAYFVQLEKGTVPTRYEEHYLKIADVDKVKMNYTVDTIHLSNSIKDDRNMRGLNEITQFGHTLCDIPIYDETLSICHPSVVRIEEGWNGYKYWMGHTPYPQSLEEPCIAASNDGVTWEEPQGISNPIFTNADARKLGYTMSSDTHLILSADKTKLMLYFRTMYGVGEGIHLATSTDGVKWDVITDIIKLPYTISTDGTTKEYISIMSPAVVIENDNTFSMWSVNSNNGKTKTVEKRTSIDGVSWSVPTICTSSDSDSWLIYHIDVKKINSTYYMLALGNPGGLRLKLLTSSDGMNWNFVNGKNIPLSGFAWDYSSHYRSTFLPKTNGKFDMWLNGVKNGVGSAWAKDSQWRVAHFKDVDLINNIFKSAPKITVYYGTIADAPTTNIGYINGDRYEYVNPTTSVGKVLVDGTWKEFGTIV